MENIEPITTLPTPLSTGMQKQVMFFAIWNDTVILKTHNVLSLVYVTQSHSKHAHQFKSIKHEYEGLHVSTNGLYKHNIQYE